MHHTVLQPPTCHHSTPVRCPQPHLNCLQLHKAAESPRNFLSIWQPVCQPEKRGLHCDFSRGKLGSAATLIVLLFIRYGACRCHPGTHPKRLVRYKWKVRNRRLLFPPFSSYTRVSDELSVCKHSFQFNSYIRRRIFWLPASQTDAKAAT